jgi:hypothetical protein
MTGSILTVALLGATLLGPDGLRVDLEDGAAWPVLALVDDEGRLVGAAHGQRNRLGWTLVVLDRKQRTRIVLGDSEQWDRLLESEPRPRPALFLDEGGQPLEHGGEAGWSATWSPIGEQGGWDSELRDPAGVVRARSGFHGDSGGEDLLDRAGTRAAWVQRDEVQTSLWIPLTPPASDPARGNHQVVLGSVRMIAVPCLDFEQMNEDYREPPDQLHCLPEAGSPYRPESRFFFEGADGKRRWIPALRWDHDLPEIREE